MRTASWVQRKAPVRFTPTIACHCSKLRSSIGIAGVPMPALLNSMSSRPNLSLIRANTPLTWAGSPTSAGAIRWPPEIWLAVCASVSSLRPTSASCQPRFARALATARPTPLPAPVIIAIFVMFALVKRVDGGPPGSAKPLFGGPYREFFPIWRGALPLPLSGGSFPIEQSRSEAAKGDRKSAPAAGLAGNIMSKRLLLALLATSGLIAAQPAFAQADTNSNTGEAANKTQTGSIEKVVVTARKREEDQQT